MVSAILSEEMAERNDLFIRYLNILVGGRAADRRLVDADRHGHLGARERGEVAHAVTEKAS